MMPDDAVPPDIPHLESQSYRISPRQLAALSAGVPVRCQLSDLIGLVIKWFLLSFAHPLSVCGLAPKFHQGVHAD